MASNIYNEGRVVGLSAYEIYVRHALSINPNIQPASELEWLSSSISTGSSMILQVTADSSSVSGHHFQEVTLPANSQLSAANTIIGSLFLGTVNLDPSGRWATNVTSYGPLLDNDVDHPTPGTPTPQDYIYPTSVTSPLDSTYQNNLNDYMKIVDGIVIQQGEWVATEGGITPPKDLTFPNIGPNSGFARQPKVRILLSDRVVYPFYILLTGFTLKAVLPGVTGMDGSTDTEHPENGDFLGPAVFPWANKIVFSVPPAYINYYVRSQYVRALNSSDVRIENVPIIDMGTTDPSTYYGTNYTSNPISYTVVETNTVKGDAVLTVYQRSSVLPPALYGTKVTTTGNNKLYPLDTVAPGTVKIFNSDGRLADAKDEASAVNQITGNIGMYRDADYIIHQTVPANASAPTDPISDVEVVQLQADRLGGQRPYAVKQTSGKKDSTSISLEDTSGNVLDRTGIHPPVFNGSRVYEESQNNKLEPVSTQPADWNNSYNSYYWNTLIAWNGDGVTTSFSFPSAAIPSELKAVTIDDYISTYGIDWTYANGVVTFSTAPANLSIIQTFVSPPTTFETINPNRSSNEKFLERKGTLHWDDLLFALANNKAIDLFDNDYFRYMMFNALQPGFGIDISLISNNRISIINTLPNILTSHMSEDSYTVRTCSLLHFDKASDTIKMKYAKSADNKYVYVRIDSIRHEIGGGATEWLSNTNLSDSSGFAFVHADTSPSSRQHSIICGIEFNTDGELYQVLHNPPQSKHYEFRDTSDYSTGIWNVQPTTARASWSAHCELRANSDERYQGDVWESSDADLDQVGTTILPEGQGWDLVVAGLSYIDGYNKQFTDTDAYPVSLGSLASNHINLSVSGVFELVDD